jgi:4-amino-4-deoxy-L-arabinose transferase-like glycosyltransferase
MTSNPWFQRLWLPAVAILLFFVAITCRPLMPVDETRYMSVAWEMSLHQDWLAPLTKNFEPYHHKPPLLFWLINLSWSLFGVSRWAGTLVVVLASFICVALTGLLAKRLAHLAGNATPDTNRIFLLMIACLPFMFYGTLVMFDFLLCVFVLLSWIAIISYSESRRFFTLVGLGLLMGLGVLTKGPVAYLYILPAFLLAPYWDPNLKDKKSWFLSVLLAIIISGLPVLLWLIPVLKASDDHFAFWLVWNQTAGRITGNFGEAHVRPFYFYLPFLPLMIAPWIFFPSFWKRLKNIKNMIHDKLLVRFSTIVFVPIFIAFSFISGKQIHYLVPLLPLLVLMLYEMVEHLQTRTMIKVFIAVMIFFIGGQFIAKHFLFEKYDLQPIAEILKQNKDKKMAYVFNYHAEFSFLAELSHTIEDVREEDIKSWFEKNPDGLAIIKYEDVSFVKDYTPLIDMEYRGRHKGVFIKRQE